MVWPQKNAYIHTYMHVQRYQLDDVKGFMIRKMSSSKWANILVVNSTLVIEFHFEVSVQRRNHEFDMAK